MRWRRLRCLVCGLIGVALAACTKPAGPDREMLGCVAPQTAQLSGTCAGITLKLVPLDAQFVRGQKFRIAYVIQNTGAPRQVRLQEQDIVLRMIDGAGKELDPQPLINNAPSDDASFILPTGGFVGRVFDLRCPTIEFAAIERCREWVVPRRGTIRVIFSVGAQSFDEKTESFYTSLDLADTISVTVVDSPKAASP